MPNPNPFSTSRLALETQMDVCIAENGLSFVLHAIVEVLYARIRRCPPGDTERAACLAAKAHQLTELEYECDTWGL